jgi:hypothetical protein
MYFFSFPTIHSAPNGRFWPLMVVAALIGFAFGDDEAFAAVKAFGFVQVVYPDIS